MIMLWAFGRTLWGPDFRRSALDALCASGSLRLSLRVARGRSDSL